VSADHDVPICRDIDAADLAARIGTADEPFVLDVREPDEVAEWSISGSLNVPAGELPQRLDEVPDDREVVVVCAAGGRSRTAAQFLSERGLRVASLRGGMAAWGRVYDRAVIDDGAVRVVQVRRRGKGCLSYIIGAGRDAFVVDPALDVDVYTEMAADQGWRITRVFDTHLHADHVSGARTLAAASGASLHLNPADTFAFAYEPLHDRERFSLGDLAVTVAAVPTPGHTQGSTIYFVGDRIVLTGDTLFIDGVGRPDLAERAEEFARNLYRSLHERVLGLPDDTLVLPGHYGDRVRVKPEVPVGARLGALRAELAPLAFDEDTFVEWATAQATPRPPNYVEIITANMGRSELPHPALQRLEAGPNRCSV
jgi:glyoxylase-like metal-dependent hydrolase (beta-lactamase superfamily II)